MAVAGAGGHRVGGGVEWLDEVPSASVGNAAWAADSPGCGRGSCDMASVVSMVAGCADLRRLWWA